MTVSPAAPVKKNTPNMKLANQLYSAILCGLLTTTSIVQWGDKVSGCMTAALKDQVVGNLNPSADRSQPAPSLTANDLAADNSPTTGGSLAPADPAEPETNNFVINANGDLVTTKDTVTRTKCGAVTLVSITITPVLPDDLIATN